MRLTFEQIQAVTVGAVWMKQTEDGIRFGKCTDKQVEAWNSESTALGYRAETTTGIRLDFHTGSKTLSFGAKGNKYELYLDGVLRKQFRLNETDGVGRFELTDALGADRQSFHVTLCLPCHEVGVLEWLELE